MLSVAGVGGSCRGDRCVGCEGGDFFVTKEEGYGFVCKEVLGELRLSQVK